MRSANGQLHPVAFFWVRQDRNAFCFMVSSPQIAWAIHLEATRNARSQRILARPGKKSHTSWPSFFTRRSWNRNPAHIQQIDKIGISSKIRIRCNGISLKISQSSFSYLYQLLQPLRPTEGSYLNQIKCLNWVQTLAYRSSTIRSGNSNPIASSASFR